MSNIDLNGFGRKMNRAGALACKLGLVISVTLLMTGCVRYDVTLNNGKTFSNVHKPVLDKEKGVYHIKNATGKDFTVKESQIRAIEPHESAKQRTKDGSNFLN